MKSSILIAVLFGTCRAIDGASILTPGVQLLDDKAMEEFQAQCMSKIGREKNVVEDIMRFRFTFFSAFLGIAQKIKEFNSLDSLDTMINDICYPVVDEDEIYSLAMHIYELCVGLGENFTDEEKQIVKSKLKRLICSVYMKFAAIVTLSSDCLSDESTINEIEKCRPSSVVIPTRMHDLFFGNNSTCSTQSKILDCVNHIIKRQCSPSIYEKIDSTLSETQNIFGCESGLDSISVIDSL